MRLTGFLFGGMVGAAAAVYMARKRPGAVAWAAHAMSDVCSSLTNKAISKFAVSGWKQEAVESAPKSIDDTAKNSAIAWEQIEALLAQDPKVKREVEKIKAESSSVAH